MNSAEFFNDMMNQSRILMTSLKYQQPYDLATGYQKSLYTSLTPMLGRNHQATSIRTLESEF
jgi:hypothetical protein